jgi:pilus assembly protein CpaB
MDRRGSAGGWRGIGAQLALRRRLAVAVFTGIAVVSGIRAAKPSPPPTEAVWVAAHDLAGGEPLATGDVRVERLATAVVPAGTYHADVTVVGRLLAAPMRTDEPLTDVRVLSPSLIAATANPNDVAVPVRVADGPAALTLVQAGDLIDVIAAPDADTGSAPTEFTVVHDVRVLSTPTRDTATTSADTAGLLIVEASNAQAATLAQAATTARFSIAVHRAP